MSYVQVCRMALALLLVGSLPCTAQGVPRMESGIASWYGSRFHARRRMANGCFFDAARLTAASRTLRLGISVRVLNLSNGLSVTVRIEDRGPYARGRIIDLSRAAAKTIGMIPQGTAPVIVQPLPLPLDPSC